MELVDVTTSQAVAILGLNKNKSPDAAIREVVRNHFHAEPEKKKTSALDWVQPMKQAVINSYAFDIDGNILESTGETSSLKPVKGVGILLTDDNMIAQFDDCEPVLMIINKKHAEFDVHQCDEKLLAKIRLSMYVNSCESATLALAYTDGFTSHRVNISDVRGYSLDIKKLSTMVSEAILEPTKYLKETHEATSSDNAVRLANRYKELSDKIKLLTQEKSDTLAELVEEVGEKQTEINGMKLTMVEKKGSVVYSNIPEIKGVSLDDYRKPKTKYWVLK